VEQRVALAQILTNFENQKEGCPLSFIDIKPLDETPSMLRERWILETCAGEQIAYSVQFGPGPFEPVQIPKTITQWNGPKPDRAVMVVKE
jgi:hypothetical protein